MRVSEKPEKMSLDLKRQGKEKEEKRRKCFWVALQPQPSGKGTQCSQSEHSCSKSSPRKSPDFRISISAARRSTAAACAITPSTCFKIARISSADSSGSPARAMHAIRSRSSHARFWYGTSRVDTTGTAGSTRKNAKMVRCPGRVASFSSNGATCAAICTAYAVSSCQAHESIETQVTRMSFAYQWCPHEPCLGRPCSIADVAAAAAAVAAAAAAVVNVCACARARVYVR